MKIIKLPICVNIVYIESEIKRLKVGESIRLIANSKATILRILNS